MLPNKEIFIIIGVLILIVDLIVTGIIGLMRKEIYAKRIFVGLFFIPLGLIGKIQNFFYNRIDNEIDRGNAAISSSIAVIALGVFILISFGGYYLSIYKILNPDIIGVLVPASLLSLMILIPVAITYLVMNQKKNKN